MLFESFDFMNNIVVTLQVFAEYEKSIQERMGSKDEETDTETAAQVVISQNSLYPSSKSNLYIKLVKTFWTYSNNKKGS